MIILGLDTETTGVDITNCSIIELGWCLWDTVKSKPLKIRDYLIQSPEPLLDEVKKVTGITDEDLATFSLKEPWRAFEELREDIRISNAVVAHNGMAFDFPLIQKEFSKYGLPAVEYPTTIDTQFDLPNCAYGKSKALTYMAADHEFINPFPHRAITDVLTMLKILSKYDIESIVNKAKSPLVVIRALTNYDQKELAKEKGFRWQELGSLKFDKCWVKLVRECEVEDIRKECSFQIAQIKRITV